MTLIKRGGSLIKKVPFVDNLAGFSPLLVAVLLTSILFIVIVIESAWDFYMVINWHQDLSTFGIIFAGLTASLLAILSVLLIIGFTGVLTKSAKIIRLYAHAVVLKGIILLIAGLIHIISVARDQDDLYNACQTENDSFLSCSTVNGT